MIALVSQLALGAVLPPDQPTPQDIAALNAVRILCDGAQPSIPADHSHHHRPAAPAICPINVTLSLPAVVPTPTPILPLPTACVLGACARERPPGRGPPPPTSHVGVPRAPPLSI